MRLYQDYIPATMPDGQGQTGSFSLVSAQRIEVLRGPFSSLYGNASGGVISVFTEDGPPVPIAGAQLIGGSYATWNAIAKAAGQSGAVNYVLAGNYFTIDGYRDHSQASRELGNARLKITASPDTSIIVIANALYQPEAQDPLGLTRAQWEANPRQADPAATLFDTRKTVNQKQAGATVEQRLSADADMRVTGVRRHAHGTPVPRAVGGWPDLVGRGHRSRRHVRRRRCTDHRAFQPRWPPRLDHARRELRIAAPAAARLRQQQRGCWATCGATRPTM